MGTEQSTEQAAALALDLSGVNVALVRHAAQGPPVLDILSISPSGY